MSINEHICVHRCQNNDSHPTVICNNTKIITTRNTIFCDRKFIKKTLITSTKLMSKTWGAAETAQNVSKMDTGTTGRSKPDHSTLSNIAKNKVPETDVLYCCCFEH